MTKHIVDKMTDREREAWRVALAIEREVEDGRPIYDFLHLVFEYYLDGLVADRDGKTWPGVNERDEFAEALAEAESEGKRSEEAVRIMLRNERSGVERYILRQLLADRDELDEATERPLYYKG